MGYWKKLGSIAKKHLGQIPYILLSPIGLVIQLLYQLIVTPYRVVCEKWNREAYRKRKGEKALRETVRTVLCVHSSRGGFQSRRTSELFTFLLQFISFVTTYAGFTFFLGPVNPVAPLFMAITVQGLCFYLLNHAPSGKRGSGWKRSALLAVLITTSTLTSYMGIFDSVVKPVDQMRVQYDSYAKIVNTLIEQEVAEKYSYDIQRKDIEQVYERMNSAVQGADAVIAILKNSNQQTVTTQVVPYSWTDENGVVHYGTKVVPIGEASNSIVANEQRVSLLNTYKTKVSGFLTQYPSVDTVLTAVNAILQSPDKLNSSVDSDKDVYNAFTATVTDLNQLNGALSEGEGGTSAVTFDMDIEKAIENARNRQALEALRLDEYDVLMEKERESQKLETEVDENTAWLAKVSGFFESLNQFVVSKELTQAEAIRDILVKTSEKNYTDLYPLLSGANQEELVAAKGYTAYENTQVMPFTAPFDRERKLLGEALFSFIIAFLVDGLSLLISWAMLSRKKSALSSNLTKSNRKDREEMVEDCLVYLCLEGMPGGLSSVEQIREFTLGRVSGILQGFWDKFRYVYIPDGLNAFAYLSLKEFSAENKEEWILFQTLSNAGLLRPFHKAELEVILRKEFEEQKKSLNAESVKSLMESYLSQFREDEVYYLVSKNLHVWFCENGADVLQKAKILPGGTDVEEASEHGR